MDTKPITVFLVPRFSWLPKLQIFLKSTLVTWDPKLPVFLGRYGKAEAPKLFCIQGIPILLLHDKEKG